MRKYGVLAAYSYVNDQSDHFGIRSAVLGTDARPNTAKGLDEISTLLKIRHPGFRDITILSLTPIEGELRKDIEDDW